MLPLAIDGIIDHALAVAAGAAPAPAPDALADLGRELGRLIPGPADDLAAQLDRVLVAEQAGAALALLQHWGCLGLWLPEVAAMVGLHRSAPHPHKDLFAHTLQVVDQTPPEADLRWVALCHDIGKPSTRAFEPGGVSFWRHEAVGAWLFHGIGARLRMPAERVDRIAFVIQHHARTNQYDRTWTDKALRRLARECGPRLRDMIAFSRSDWSTRRSGRVQAIHAGLDDLERRLAALAADDTAPRPPAGLSHALLAAGGRAPGPWVGEAIARAMDAAASGVLDADAPLSRWVAVALGDSGSRP